jgi:hypothetical protein
MIKFEMTANDVKLLMENDDIGQQEAVRTLQRHELKRRLVKAQATGDLKEITNIVEFLVEKLLS